MRSWLHLVQIGPIDLGPSFPADACADIGRRNAETSADRHLRLAMRPMISCTASKVTTEALVLRACFKSVAQKVDGARAITNSLPKR
jgi:hypothetical protein